MIAFERVIPEGCPADAWQGLALDADLQKIGSSISEQTGAAGDVALALADDGFLASLNQRYRGIEKPTNVLSFPADPDDQVFPTDREQAFLGDIALAVETITAEAEQSSTPIVHHIAHLIVHGTLHLLGHDHMQEHDAVVMESLEARILAELGIPDPYAEL